MVHNVPVEVLVVPFKLEAGLVGGAEHTIEAEVGLLELGDAVGVVGDVGGGIVARGDAHVLIEHVGDIVSVITAVVFAWVGHAAVESGWKSKGGGRHWRFASKPAHFLIFPPHANISARLRTRHIHPAPVSAWKQITRNLCERS